jgi:hypothetical protein
VEKAMSKIAYAIEKLHNEAVENSTKARQKVIACCKEDDNQEKITSEFVFHQAFEDEAWRVNFPSLRNLNDEEILEALKHIERKLNKELADFAESLAKTGEISGLAAMRIAAKGKFARRLYEIIETAN